jgi:diguanylate cyclase (GGDEF)-like protein/putative nucleotidyltransferase with HDIG domain
LLAVYSLAIPCTIACFVSSNRYPAQWLLLTVISLFVATVNVRLPTISSVISMGDVFTILALTQFGAGPALIMYWLDMVVGQFSNAVRHHGLAGVQKVKTHKVLFNLACCSLSIIAMAAVYQRCIGLGFAYPTNFVIALLGLSISWFLVNTLTLSIAISFWSQQPFWPVWREGLGLALLNFLSSAAGAGLITLLYSKTQFLVFLLSLPIAVVVYQLYSFYVDRYEQANKHIGELNELYLQTIEALASAVDAKDQYTHGHIRRVQAYARELARYCGITAENELLALEAGAVLHDIGKIAIPEYILNKPTVLTETEYEKMKIHPVVGANMLSTIKFPYPLIPVVKSHHERWDGKGYPDGLQGEEIPLSARILSLVDCYDALTTNRPYRSPMNRQQVVEFFEREAGRAYDPAVVRTFIENIEVLEQAGKAVVLIQKDIWGLSDTGVHSSSNIRPLEKAQSITSFGKALNAEPRTQRELFLVFEFARGQFGYLSKEEVFTFMGDRLRNLLRFDSAVFYAADLTTGALVASHIVGEEQAVFRGLTIRLEQKLTGWVAANNQSLCNLPPFPDFLTSTEPRPSFQISAIVPMNCRNQVFGAISAYRNQQVKFTDEEFRRLEIIGSQTAILLAKCSDVRNDASVLVDQETNLPNGLQLYLMFDKIAIEADRYEYPLALLSIDVEDIALIRQKWGALSANDALQAIANHLRTEVRDTDLLARYAAESFIALNPRMSREQAENLKSRLQNDLDHFKFNVRGQTQIPLRASIGIAVFPEDGTDLQNLLSVATLRSNADRELRTAVKQRVRRLPTS